MNILAFVPARSGSKGIKNKNMVILGNKPLIYYTINTIKKINASVYPFISTDSKKIKRYCEKKYRLHLLILVFLSPTFLIH